MKRAGSQKRAPGKSSFRWFFFAFVSVGVCIVLAGVLAAAALYYQVERSLPSVESLKTYHPPLVSSVYASDGTLIGEFNAERRYIVPVEELPPLLIKAFLAAEDVRFYEHGGVDFLGIVRASLKNLQAGEIVQGGSTITQQVVKSLLLTPERTYVRKLKEAILAYRIDHYLTKDQILYLYLNQIYFGAGAYGVEAAAQTYFDKHARELSLAEASLLAGLPKAPSRFSPHTHFPAAKERQQYVLQRMAEVGFVTYDDAKLALAAPLQVSKPKHWKMKDLDSFTEEVRRQVEARYGREGLYREGLKIYTTMDVKAQQLAEKALDQGLHELDRRHRRYRGVHLNVAKDDWPNTLKTLVDRNGPLLQGQTVGALVTDFDTRSRTVLVNLGSARGKVPPSGWEWTQISGKRAARMFRAGDLIRVRLQKMQEDGVWQTVLEQDPGMEGAIMSMEPETGRVICMVGGRNFEKSQFNRCTQAIRQPGSAFKPIIYAAALDKGYTETSILIDSPLVLDDHSLRGPWKPANYDRQFWGPILLRRALVHSRNVVTVKLLSAIGVDYAINYARQLGINSSLTPTLALALGSSGLTLSELLTAYSAFANQGDRVEPYLIEKICDRNGNLIEEHQVKRVNVIPAPTAYIMTHLLQGVVEEGTGARAKELGRPAAGKTGTTNEMKDAWFVGYTPTVLTGVWVGYDDHNLSLGKGETGGRAACPIWVYFMKEYLKDKPVLSFPIPSGVVFARVNPGSGNVIRGEEQGGIFVAFAGDAPPEPKAPRANAEGYSAMPSSPAESFFKSDLF